MPAAQHSVLVDRPVEQVFAFFTDPSNDLTWRSHVKEIEAQGPLAVGTRVHQVVKGRVRLMAGSPPWIGDLAQGEECLVHLPERLGPDAVGPFGQDTLHLGVGGLDDPLRARSQTHQPGAAVGGVGHPLDIPSCFELFDEEAGTLLGDPGLLCQVGNTGSARTDPGRNAGLRLGDVGDAGCDDCVVCPLLECSVGDEQQDAEVRLLTVRGHRVRLDR